jgi:hemerythrin-like domain-containing protein
MIADFSKSHANIMARLMTFCGLPAMLEDPAAARMLAADAVQFFREVVMGHHIDEERSLFPTMLARTQGEELQSVRALVDRLTKEHRQLEANWAQLEPVLTQIADGESFDLDSTAIEAMVLDYAAHAAFEEAGFLPLCKTVLERTKDQVSMADLGHKGAWAPTFPAPLQQL